MRVSHSKPYIILMAWKIIENIRLHNVKSKKNDDLYDKEFNSIFKYFIWFAKIESDRIIYFHFWFL